MPIDSLERNIKFKTEGIETIDFLKGSVQVLPLSVYEKTIDRISKEKNKFPGIIAKLAGFKKILGLKPHEDHYTKKDLEEKLLDFYTKYAMPIKETNTGLRVEKDKDIETEIELIKKEKGERYEEEYRQKHQEILKKLSAEELKQGMGIWLEFFNRSEIIKNRIKQHYEDQYL